MDEKMLKYREKHKKCTFCKYARACPISSIYYICSLKSKVYNFDYSRFHGFFCKYYTVKEKNIN